MQRGTGDIVTPDPTLLDTTTIMADKPKVTIGYLFAGKERHTGLGSELKLEFEDKGFHVVLEEVDVCRDDNSNLLDPAHRARFIEKVHHEWDLSITTPPCNTHSRLLWSNRWGPKPLRTKEWPEGFPWLKGAEAKKVSEANTLIDFNWEVCMIVADKIDRGILSFALCEHPEDLGVVDSGQWPASIWQSQRHLHLVNERGWSSFGLRQCDHGCDRPKPTRMVSPFDTIASGVQSWVGLPIFSARGENEVPTK